MSIHEELWLVSLDFNGYTYQSNFSYLGLFWLVFKQYLQNMLVYIFKN